jgi:putative oxidoreductase
MIAALKNVTWQQGAIGLGSLIFAAVFLMAATFKAFDFGATAAMIGAAGFVFPQLLTIVAAAFEFVIVLSFLTRKFLTPVALLAAVYVLFLGFAFHGPSHWGENQLEFVIFINHFPFTAGLLFAAVYNSKRGVLKTRFQHGLDYEGTLI